MFAGIPVNLALKPEASTTAFVGLLTERAVSLPAFRCCGFSVRLLLLEGKHAGLAEIMHV